MNPGGPTQRDLREGWGVGVQRSVAVAGRRHRDDQVMVMVMDVEGSAKRDVREDWRASIVEHRQGEEKKKRVRLDATRTVLLRQREGSCAHRGVVHVVQQEGTSQCCCAEGSDVPCCRLYNVRTQYHDRYGTLP